MPKGFRFTAITGVCLAVAVLCIVAAIVYFTKTADALPSFFPGHSAGSTKHHTKHGLGMIMLALVALFGAWMSTAAKAD